jgi:hypothetical protein
MTSITLSTVMRIGSEITLTSGLSALQRARARLDLRLADVRGGVQDLPLEVRDVDDVAVHQPERADAGGAR